MKKLSIHWIWSLIIICPLILGCCIVLLLGNLTKYIASLNLSLSSIGWISIILGYTLIFSVGWIMAKIVVSFKNNNPPLFLPIFLLTVGECVGGAVWRSFSFTDDEMVGFIYICFFMSLLVWLPYVFFLVQQVVRIERKENEKHDVFMTAMFEMHDRDCK